MDYLDALQYLYQLTDYEQLPGQAYRAANFDLRRVEQLLEGLGNPHRGPKTVHIAGTKGKGSTAAMIASVLSEAGYRTGLFTSPHLHTFRERIRVGDALISEEAVARGVSHMAPIVEEVNHTGQFGRLTTFELIVALAFSYFQQQEVQVQVMEVGLGGRLDATNVVTPDLCLVTSLSLDHTEVLGETLEQIAREKAGIIKPFAPVVTAPQAPEALAVLREVCQREGTELTEVERELTWRERVVSPKGQSFTLQTPRSSYELRLPLLGAFQMENAALAVAGLELLASRGLAIPPEAVARGLCRVRWPGRLQVLSRQPLLMVDGAHNPYSAQKLLEAVEHTFSFDRLILIVGTSQDKDMPGIAAALAPRAWRVIAARSRHPRAASASGVAEAFAGLGVETQIVDDPGQAVERAKELAGPGDLICATGSLFLVAEVIQHVEGLPAPESVVS